MRILPISMAATLASMSGPAFAQSTGVISLGGDIVPSSCSIGLTGNGIVNYGEIPASEFNDAGGSAQLPVRTIDLQVTCATAYQVAMTITDNRRGTLMGPSANSWLEFGIGRNAEGTRHLGMYTITPATSSNTLPSGTVQVLRSNALSTWVANGDRWAKMNVAGSPTAYKYISPGTGATPVGVTSATIRLSVHLVLEPLSYLHLTQEAPLDGSSTIELVYL